MRRNRHVVHQLVPDFVLRPNVPPVLVGTLQDGIDPGTDIRLVECELLLDEYLIDALHLQSKRPTNECPYVLRFTGLRGARAFEALMPVAGLEFRFLRRLERGKVIARLREKRREVLGMAHLLIGHWPRQRIRALLSRNEQGNIRPVSEYGRMRNGDTVLR